MRIAGSAGFGAVEVELFGLLFGLGVVEDDVVAELEAPVEFFAEAAAAAGAAVVV